MSDVKKVKCEVCGRNIKKGFLLEDNTFYCSVTCLLTVMDFADIEEAEKNTEIDFVSVNDIYGD